MRKRSRCRNSVGANPRSKGVARRLTACEALEPRLVLTALLRPGATPDSVVVAAAAEGGGGATAGPAPLSSIDTDGRLVVDLSADRPTDQRYGFKASEDGPWFRVATDRAYGLIATGDPFIENTPRGSFGYRSYDADGNEIEPLHVAKHAFAADTVLTAALRPGDRSFLIADASGWSNEVGAAAETRALAWYGYHDASGRKYADYTYTRNVAVGGEEGLWQAGEVWFDPSVGAYRVPLHEPWQGPELVAGAAVRNTANGLSVATPFPESLSNEPRRGLLSATIAGEWTDGRPDPLAFRPGTEFVQPFASYPAGVWSDLAIGPAEDFSVPEETVPVNASANSFTLELDVLVKRANSFTGDYNGDGRVDAADYGLWRDAEGATGVLPHTGADGDGNGRIDAADAALWRSQYGATPQLVIDAVSAEIGGATIVDGKVAYAAPAFFVGADLVSYTIRDLQSGQTFSSEVIVNALGGNEEQDPAVVAELGNQAELGEVLLSIFDPYYATAVGETLVGTELLNNVRARDHLFVARLLSGPLHGTLELQYDGTFRYTPDEGFVGTDAFRYEFFDGNESIGAVATIETVPAADLARRRLQQIGFAMVNYEGSFSRFPLSSTFDDNGNRLLSWRVHVLPFLGQQSLYERFNLDEPWDSPNNLPLAFEMPAAYRSAGDASDSVTTRFQTFNGPDAPFGRLPDGEP